MKKYLHFILLLTTILLIGCQETTKTVYRDQNPNQWNPGTTNGGTSGGYCMFNSSHPSYWTTNGCQGYQQCQQNQQSNPSCPGYNGGTTSSGSNGGSTGGTNPTTGVCAQNPNSPFCQPNYCGTSGAVPYGCILYGFTRVNCYINPTHAGCGGSSQPVAHNPNWGVWYPGGEPSGSCSSTYTPVPLNSAFETRKGTVTIAGGGRNTGDPATSYNVIDKNGSQHYYNTSELLTSTTGVKQFYLTDAILKLRIKVLPEPYAAGDLTVCKGRKTGSYVPGYTKLEFNINVYGITSSGGNVYIRSIPYTGSNAIGVNNCTPSIDLSRDQENYPYGVFVTVENIKENKNCSQPLWNGWASCNQFNKVRSLECVRLDFEVAADGTKTFD